PEATGEGGRGGRGLLVRGGGRRAGGGPAGRADGHEDEAEKAQQEQQPDGGVAHAPRARPAVGSSLAAVGRSLAVAWGRVRPRLEPSPPPGHVQPHGAIPRLSTSTCTRSGATRK